MSFVEENLAAIMFSLSSYKTLTTELQDKVHLRPLRADDHSKGYLELVAKDESANVNKERALRQYLSAISSMPNTYYPIVAEETTKNRIIGTAVLIVEQKFIHDANIRARIEDVHVDAAYQNEGIDSIIMEALAVYAGNLGCYKVNMTCPLNLASKCEQLQMVHEAGQNTMIIPIADRLNNNSSVTKSML